MMAIKDNLLRGQLVRLSIEEPDEMASVFSRWSRNTEYLRLLDGDPARTFSKKQFKTWFEEDQKKEQPDNIFFMLSALEDERLIGFIGLFGVQWQHGDAWVGIGIGEPDFWGNGYGTDAMCTILRYAFTEANLHRVTLGVFAYNPRAIRSYEKAGFRREGIERQVLRRDGERADVYIMGVLRSEWEQGQP